MSTATHDSAWIRFRDRFTIGQLVEGVVVAHVPAGMFVDIGSARFVGLVELPSLGDSPRAKHPLLPAIGSRVTGVLLGFTEPQHQPRISLRPSLLREASQDPDPAHHQEPSMLDNVAEIWGVAQRPQAQRLALLQQTLRHPDPEMTARAVWQVQHLPQGERAEFLRQALLRRDPEVATAVIWQVQLVPDRKRAAIFQIAYHQLTQWQEPTVVARAIAQVRHLPMEERVAFLHMVLQHPDPAVAARAVEQAIQLPQPHRNILLQEARLHREPAVAEAAIRASA